MSVEGSSHLGPDESVKQELTERLLADLAELALFLVEAKLLPVLPQGVLYDMIMAWAAEASEHADNPRERQADGTAVPVFNFERLVELSCEDTQLQKDLVSATQAAKAAASKLAMTSPNTQAWREAKQALEQANRRLNDVSARLMEHDDGMRVAATESVDNLHRARRTAFIHGVKESLDERDRVASEAPKALDVTRSALFGSASVEGNRYRDAGRQVR